MNIKNMYLVRVVNDIPFFNIVKPVANSHYIRKERDSVFYFAMSDLLKEKGELKEID